MDSTEDVSARILLKHIMNEEPPRTPLTRSVAAQGSGQRRSGRLSTNAPAAHTPQGMLRRSLKHKMRESLTRTTLASKRTTASTAFKQTPGPSSMLFDDRETPRQIIKNILLTEPVKSPLINKSVDSQKQDPQKASPDSSRPSRPSVELSGLELSDLTIGNIETSIKRLTRKRPHRSLNVTAFENRLGENDAAEEEEMMDQSSLSLSSSTSLSLKTPFIDVQTEKKALQRKRSNLRKVSVDDFGAAVARREMGIHDGSISAPGQVFGETTGSETFGLSRISEPDITVDLLNCNTALYGQAEGLPNFSTLATQEKPTVMASQIQRDLREQLEVDQEPYSFPTEEKSRIEGRSTSQSPEMADNEDNYEDVPGPSFLPVDDAAAAVSTETAEEEEEEVCAENVGDQSHGAPPTKRSRRGTLPGSTLEDDGTDPQTNDEAEGVKGETEEQEEAEGLTQGENEEEEEAAGLTQGENEEEEEEAAAGLTQGETEEEEAEGLTQGETEEEEGGTAEEEEEAEGVTQGETEEEEAEGLTQGETEEEAEGLTQGETEEEEEAEGLTQGETEEEEAEGLTQGETEEEEGVTQRETEEEEEEAEVYTEGDEEEAEDEDQAADVMDFYEDVAEVVVMDDGEEAGDSEQAEDDVESDEEADDRSAVDADSQEDGDSEQVAQRAVSAEADPIAPLHSTAADLPDAELEYEETAEQSSRGSVNDKENAIQESGPPDDDQSEASEEEEEEEEDQDEEDDLPSETPAFVKQKRKFFHSEAQVTPLASKNIQPSPEDPRPKSKPRAQRKPRSSKRDPGLPKSYVMNVFKHFAKTKVSADVYPVLKETMDKFFNHVAKDLEAYALHAKRSTIDVADCELLLRRQGHVNDKVPVEVLIEKYLRLDQRKLLIPIATSGNVVIPKR